MFVIIEWHIAESINLAKPVLPISMPTSSEFLNNCLNVTFEIRAVGSHKPR